LSDWCVLTIQINRFDSAEDNFRFSGVINKKTVLFLITYGLIVVIIPKDYRTLPMNERTNIYIIREDRWFIGPDQQP
jgi:hypothetical protein